MSIRPSISPRDVIFPQAFLPKNMLKTKKGSTVDKYSASEPLPPLELMEKNYILKVYHQMDKNKSKTAEILGIDRKTLQQKNSILWG